VKKQFLNLAGLLILFILPLSLMAQDRGQGQGQVDRAARAKQQQEELKKTLALNKDQGAKFDKIYEDFNKKRTEMMEGMTQGGDRTAMRDKMTKMNASRDDSIKKVLDKGQVKKYDEYLKKQAEARQNRGNRGGGGGR